MATTPIKKGIQASAIGTITRVARIVNLRELSYKNPERFFDDVLPQLPDNHKKIYQNYLPRYEFLIRRREKIDRCKESNMHPIVLGLLNTISRDISSEDSSTKVPLSFTVPANTGPHGMAAFRQTKPDYLAQNSTDDNIEQLITAALNPSKSESIQAMAECSPYEKVPSVGEEKPRDSGTWTGQLQTFAMAVKENRPDLSGVFCFYADFNGFRIGYFSPCGFIQSTHQNWSELEKLFRYVSALYKQQHVPAIHFDDRLSCWNLQLNGISYLLAPFYSREGPGRMPFVSQALETTTGDNPKPLIAKLSWRDINRRPEGEMLKYLHEDGIIAGAVVMKNFGDLECTISNADTHVQRQCTALVLASTGDPLSQCHSVHHFLCVMYDLVQTLENCNNRGILSRDVSWYNVYCNPKHQNIVDSQRWTGNGKSINEILDQGDPDYQCLLGDFDYAVRWRQKRSCSVVERTGTPMYIPLDIITDEGGEHNWVSFGSIRPILSGVFSDRDLVGKIGCDDLSQKFALLQGKYEYINIDHDELPKDYQTEHLPRHDVESVFWIMCWWLSRSYPGTSDAGNASDDYSNWVNTMLTQSMKKRDIVRPFFRRQHERSWKSILHPDFSFLSNLLHNFGVYLSAPWIHMDKEPESAWPWNHAHTVLKMLLLKEIVALRDKIDVHRTPRPAEAEATADYTKGTTTTTTTSSSKRSHPPEVEDEAELSARIKRPRLNQAARAPMDPPEEHSEQLKDLARGLVEKAQIAKRKIIHDRMFRHHVHVPADIFIAPTPSS